MPTTVDIPSVGVVEFPDEMSQEDIARESESLYTKATGPKPTETTDFFGSLEKRTQGMRAGMESVAQMTGDALRPITAIQKAGAYALHKLGFSTPEQYEQDIASIENRQKLLPSIPQQKAIPAQVGAGAGNAVIEFVNAFGDPDMLAMIGLGGASTEAKNAVLTYFGTTLATTAPQQLQAATQAFKEKRWQQGTQQLSEGLIASGLSAKLGGEVLKKPGAVVVPSEKAALTPLTTEAVKEAGVPVKVEPTPVAPPKPEIEQPKPELAPASPELKGEVNAVPERSPAQVPVEVPPVNREAVVPGVPEPERPAIAQVGETAERQAPEAPQPSTEGELGSRRWRIANSIPPDYTVTDTGNGGWVAESPVEKGGKLVITYSPKTGRVGPLGVKVQQPTLPQAPKPPEVNKRQLNARFSELVDTLDQQAQYDILSEMGYDINPDNGRMYMTDRDNRKMYLTGDQLTEAKQEFVRLAEERVKPQPTELTATPEAKAEETAPRTPAQQMQEQMTEVAKTEGQRPAKEVKEELVSSLEDALKTPRKGKTILIDIPGDGRFRIANTREAIESTLKRAKRISLRTQPSEPAGGQGKRPPAEVKTVADFEEAVRYHGLEPADKIAEWSPALAEAARRLNPASPESVTVADVYQRIESKRYGKIPAKEGEPPKPPIVGMGGAVPGESAQGAISMPGPPLGAGAGGGHSLPVKSQAQIIRDIAQGLDIPIRFGRLTTTKFAGYFKKLQNLIGSKKANDVPIVSHEAGHKLDTMFSLSADPALQPELDMLGNPATPGSRSSWTPSKSKSYRRAEGAAEFIRLWLTEPSQAQTSAPNLYARFDRILADNKDLSDVMRQARQDIHLWRTATAEARIDSQISVGDNPNGTRYGVSDLTRDLVDDLHYVKLAVDHAKESGEVPPAQNPYLLARLLRGSYGQADTFIRKGVVDFNSRRVALGTSLEDALKPLAGRINEFRRWIVAKQAQELHRQNKETGLLPGDVDATAAKYASEPGFQDAFDKVKAWQDAALKYAQDAGLISADSAAAMRKMNADYVPFHRVFEVGAGEAAAESAVGLGRGLNVGKPSSLRGRHGSPRPIVDPLETMMKNAYVMITAADKNAVSLALADLANRKDMGRWIERIAQPKEHGRVGLEKIRQQLEDAGADLSAVPDDLMLEFFQASRQPPAGENTIKVNRGGNLEFYRLDKHLYETFHMLDAEDAGKIIRILSAPAQWLRAGVTLTPDFALSNAIRDTVSASVISRYGSLPFESTIRGLFALAGKPGLVAEWAASGGKQAIETTYFDREQLQRFMRKRITKDMTGWETTLQWMKSPLTAMRTFTGLLEEATRLGEYEKVFNRSIASGMDEANARRLAAFEARDLQDFAKGGAQTKVIRRLAAFWNAQLQGNVRLFQAFKERPIQTLAKGFAFVTIPKLLEQALNWNDDDYWDRPQWERDLFFLLPYGKDANGHTKFIRIPTPFEVGLIFGTMPGRVLEWAKTHRAEAMTGFPETLLKQTVPNPMPQSALTALEVFAGPQGYSYWRGRPIVPGSLSEKAPALQFTEQNSVTARKAGELLNISPMKIDYAIRGMGGGLAAQATHQLVDRPLSALTGMERTAKTTVPGGRFVTTPAGIASESVDRFYKKLTELRQQKTAENLRPAGLAFMERQADAISKLRHTAVSEKDDAEKQKFYLRMAELAKSALESIQEK